MDSAQTLIRQNIGVLERELKAMKAKGADGRLEYHSADGRLEYHSADGRVKYHSADVRRQKYTSTDVHIKEYLVESVVGDINVAVSEDESGNESCVDSETTDTNGNDLTVIVDVATI